MDSINCGTLKEKNGFLRFGLIGLGARGQKHLDVLATCSSIKIVGLCDTNSESLSPFIAKYPTYSDPFKFIKETSPDALVLALPHDSYMELLNKCGLCGIHVLKEKPLARSFQEAYEIFVMSKRWSNIVAVATQRRQSKAWNFLYDEFTSKHLAPCGYYEYCLGLTQIPDNWRNEKNRAGGGALLDMGYHVIDLLTWIFGIPVSATAHIVNLSESRINQKEIEHNIFILLKYSSGSVVTVVMGRELVPKIEHFKAWTSKSSWTLSQQGLSWDKEDVPIPNHVLLEDSLTLLHWQLYDFIHSISTNESPKANIYNSLGTMFVIEMCYEASRCNRTIYQEDVVKRLRLGSEYKWEDLLKQEAYIK